MVGRLFGTILALSFLASCTSDEKAFTGAGKRGRVPPKVKGPTSAVIAADEAKRTSELTFTLAGEPVPIIDSTRGWTKPAFFYDHAETAVYVEVQHEDCATVLARKPEAQFPLMEKRPIGGSDALYFEGYSRGNAGHEGTIGYVVCTSIGPVGVTLIRLKSSDVEEADRSALKAVAESLSVGTIAQAIPSGWIAYASDDKTFKASFPSAPEKVKDALGRDHAAVKLPDDGGAIDAYCFALEGSAKAAGEEWVGLRRGLVGDATVISEKQILRAGMVGMDIVAERKEPKPQSVFARMLRRDKTACVFIAITPKLDKSPEAVRSFLGTATLQ